MAILIGWVLVIVIFAGLAASQKASNLVMDTFAQLASWLEPDKLKNKPSDSENTRKGNFEQISIPL